MSWSTVRADQFCTLITDGTHDSPKPQQSGWKLITSKHLKGHYIDFDSANWISEADYLKVISRSAVEQWDILFSMIGTIGNIYLEKNPHVEYACKNMGIFKFSGNKENALWMYYYLRSPQAKAYIQTHLRGSTQAYVPLGGLREMPVPVPPQTVRNEIIAILRPIDEKIECNNAINDNLQRQLLTIFKAEFTDNSELEKMTQIPLSELCHVVTKGTTPTTLGKPFVESGIIFIKAESILADHSLDKSKFAFIDEETNALLKRSVIHAGDIVFTIAGTLGRFALIDDNALPANTNQAVAIIRADAEKVLPEYIYTCFIGEWHTDYYAKRVQQAVQANLSLTTIKSLPIPVLDKAKMDEYLRLILPLIKAIKGNEAQNEKLAALRDALLPKLMSGEIDVSAVQL